MRTVMYPGTFDPVTSGHVDLMERALRMFDRVVVAVAASGAKGPMFTQEERVELIKGATAGLKGVKVVPFSMLTVQFAKEQKAVAIMRGRRGVEIRNGTTSSSIETVFLCPNEEYSYVNSTLVKEIAKLGGDIREFVPVNVRKALAKKLKAQGS